MAASFDLKTILRDYLLSDTHAKRLKNNSANNRNSTLQIEKESKCINCGKEEADVEKMGIYSMMVWYDANGFTLINEDDFHFCVNQAFSSGFPVWSDWMCDICFRSENQWRCIWSKNKGFSSIDTILNSEEKETMNHLWTSNF